MGSFTDELEVRYLNDKDTWMILRTFEFHAREKNSDLFICVREGDTTDFFSIPWIARWLIPKSGRGNQAAALHDIGYQTGMVTARIGDKTRDYLINKSAIDSMFLDAMVVLNVNFFKRQVTYNAVRLFGFIAWNRYRRNQYKR